MNCKPGDLAVVVDAYNPTNIGSILRILRTHEDQAALLIEPGDHIWTMVATHPQAYEQNGEIHYLISGPVPDSVLRPIRGLPLGKDIAEGLPHHIFENKKAAR